MLPNGTGVILKNDNRVFNEAKLASINEKPPQLTESGEVLIVVKPTLNTA